MSPEITLLTQAVQEMLSATSGDPKFADQRQILYTVLTEVHGAAFAYDLAARTGDSNSFPDTGQRIACLKALHERYDDEYNL
jgi:hypothetical protein